LRSRICGDAKAVTAETSCSMDYTEVSIKVSDSWRTA